MRAKVTIREEKQHATIAETTTDKGIQTQYESMRVKLNKTFQKKSANKRALTQLDKASNHTLINTAKLKNL